MKEFAGDMLAFAEGTMGTAGLDIMYVNTLRAAKSFFQVDTAAQGL